MIVSEFIEWLKEQDQDAIVECVVEDKYGEYKSVEFNPEFSNYTDFRGNKFVKPTRESYNKRFLLIGEL